MDSQDSSEASADKDFDALERTPSSVSVAAALAQSPIDGVRQAVHHLTQGVVDKSSEMKETLKRFQGKVFHAVSTSHGTMLRYRVGLDGKITLEKRLKGIYVTADKLHEARQNLVQAGKAVPLKAQRKWREVVTGDPNKRIRDHIKETPQVKMLDKVSFTIGVIVICFAEWLILRMPNYFSLFYYVLMAFLWAYRYYDYSSVKSELYMLDFCYFVNLSVALQTAFYPDNMLWFKANYVMTMGPICIAIVVWRNSLVFHSLDKVTSFFLHAFPTMMCHIYRWKLVDHGITFTDDYIGLEAHFAVPLVMYALWQVGYLFITEVALRQRLEADKEIITSQRHLARDVKNPVNKLVTKICRKYGWIGKEDGFDPETLMAKIVFVVAQLSYTLLTIVHPPILFKSYYLSCFYLVTIFTMAVWNGASYYIEVFSKRYNLKFVEKTMEMPKYSDKDTSSQGDGSSVGNAEDQEDINDDFVEALEDLDLSEPLTMELYSQLLEPLVNQDYDDASVSSQDASTKTSRDISEEPTTVLIQEHYENNESAMLTSQEQQYERGTEETQSAMTKD